MGQDRVERLKKDYDVEVEWKAFELHPEFPPEGITLDREGSPRLKAMRERLRQMAEEVSLPLAASSKVPNSRLSLEAAEFARDKGKFDEYHKALFHAYFGEGRDIGDKAVLAEVAQVVGLNPDELRKALDARTYEAAVQEQVDAAHDLGITAVPTYIIGNRAVVGAQSYDVFKLVMSSLNMK